MRTIPVLLALVALSAPARAEDSHAAAARELLEVMQQRRITEAQFDELYPRSLVIAEDLDVPDEERETYERMMARMVEILREEMSWQKIEPALVEAYTSVFSEAELRELSDLFATPAGRLYVERTPQLLAETNRVMRETMTNLARKFGAIPKQMAEEEMRSKHRQEAD